MTFNKGRDFTELDDGRVIFSREYLFARGTCCGSNCLNCPFKFDKSKKSESVLDQRPIISMVPSWTETLITAGANVVGRTRFCIHPSERVRSIPVLGGTKNLAQGFEDTLNRILLEQKKSSALKPLVVLDKEENPKDFVNRFLDAGCEVIATEVTSISEFRLELLSLSSVFSEMPLANSRSEAAANLVQYNLVQYANRLDKVLQHNTSSMRSGPKPAAGFSEALIKDFISKSPTDLSEIYRKLQAGEWQLVYVIWKSPWMCVGTGTFIESVLNLLFQSSKVLWSSTSESRKYPEFELSEVPHNALLVYSSEPYPFEKEVGHLQPGILVDGEKISWFGIRAIRYLENVVGDLNMSPKAAYRDESKPR